MPKLWIKINQEEYPVIVRWTEGRDCAGLVKCLELSDEEITRVDKAFEEYDWVQDFLYSTERAQRPDQKGESLPIKDTLHPEGL